MDLMMATIMLRQIPTRNTTCINIPSQGQLNGFSHYLDLNQIAPTQDQEAIYRKLFKVQKITLPHSLKTADQVVFTFLLFSILRRREYRRYYML